MHAEKQAYREASIQRSKVHAPILTPGPVESDYRYSTVRTLHSRPSSCFQIHTKPDQATAKRSNSNHQLKFFRPFARRRARIFRPSAVLLRERKPWRRFWTRREGLYVHLFWPRWDVVEKQEVCWETVVVVGEGRREGRVSVRDREMLERERVRWVKGELCGRMVVSCLCEMWEDFGDVKVDVEAKARVLCRCRRVERRLIRALKLGVREGIESKMHFTTWPQRRHISKMKGRAWIDVSVLYSC